MKAFLVPALGLTVALWTGCASDSHTVVSESVGPALVQPGAPSRNGRLVVFSAYDPSEHFNSLPYDLFYTDYKILAQDGKLLRKVVNNPNPSVPGPTSVELPAGEYRVVARANGYGTVTVPVVIAAHRITRVHLEGGGAYGYNNSLVPATPVRLPHGEIIGWQAITTDPAQPAPLVLNGKDHQEQNDAKSGQRN